MGILAISLIIADNPADYIRMHTTEAPEVTPYTFEQMEALLKYAEQCNLTMQVVIWLATLGLRRSEICGLRFGSIDWDNNKFTIESTIVKVKTLHLQDSTKTVKSRRDIIMPDGLKSLLYQIQQQKKADKLFFGAGYTSNDYVFTTKTGNVVSPDNMGKAFKKIVADAGLPHYTLHGLRHTAATLMHSMGYTARDLQEQFGWSSTRMLARYVHISEERKRDMTANYLNALGQSTPTAV